MPIEDDVELWLLWKQAYELVRADVVGQVSAHVDLNEPELTVLVHVHRAGGSMRQNALAVSTGWDRTRLSHVLTRMATRQLISRNRLSNGVEVLLEPEGRAIVARSHEALATALQQHWTAGMTTEERRVLSDVLRRVLH